MPTQSLTRRILIVADDLTGAADSAARCHHAGLPASIFLHPPALPLPAGALALTTDSRHVGPNEAANLVTRVIRQVAATPDLTWYKKIDSTLRGNVGSELDALLTHLGGGEARPCALISPAFPAQGRGLVGGYLVHAETAPRSLHLPTLLAAQSDRPQTAIALDDVRQPTRLRQRLEQAAVQGIDLIVLDAMTEDDLVAIVAVAEQTLPKPIFVGSAGLVGVLAKSMDKPQAASALTNTRSSATDKGAPVLAVIGSGSEMAQRQLAALRASGAITCLEIDASGSDEVEKWLTEPGKRDAVICLTPPAPGARLDGPEARKLAQRLADAAMLAIDALDPRRLILSGGDTAIHVLARLGVERLDVVAELMPGIPLCHGRDRADRRREVVLKAGNHGDPQTLLQLFARGN